MPTRKQLNRVYESYGQVPDVEYYTGDMEHIRTYYDARASMERHKFFIDDITWKDLNMDAVFRRINTGLCTAGEQYLYYMLRRPMDQSQFQQQCSLIDLMEKEPETRKTLQKLLYKVGRYRPINLTETLHNRHSSPFWLILYIVLAVFFLVSIVLMFVCGQIGLWALLLSSIVNGITHEYRTHCCEREIQTVNYCVALTATLQKVKKLRHSVLDQHLQEQYVRLHNLQSVLNIGPVMSTVLNDIASAIMTVLLLDLITFELLKNRLAKHQKHFAIVHEAIGQLDASIAIASYRHSIDFWTVPDIDFSAKHAYLHACDIIHPLLKHPVPNHALLERSMLITGANASGKSTYLKATLLCALLAQTICTATCSSYHASTLRVYSSMAIADDLYAGESYYIAEIRSLKRILDAQNLGIPILCAVDEVLRGTNTLERIAASTEVLKALCGEQTLCIVATHDAELCDLVQTNYDMAHFQENITDDEVSFDYRIKPGKATSRNAIELLRLMGFAPGIVKAAHERLDHYLQTGKWQENLPHQSTIQQT